ncbi:outer membrane lipoprotein chaperone LolA [Legionella impletisoli]|uniref:Outer-membrane lipoprotein carrier protein n=1 Tax=Legionella impletisoli TaxID=343510 RepID=A0A917JP23_9GAMM|nr:outer membrane lipoprotein chaperone LolA [Legionella impletisoli]GGI79561.1 outer-membrane lipoprotein carrier protein [Legionella impletisoli]
MRKLALVLLCVVMQQAYSNEASAVLQKKLNAIHTMSASFKQVVQAKKRQLSSSSGTMALSRPGRFRWDTKEPMAQLVVADGAKLWIYDKELEQVTVKKQQKGIGGTAGLFLSGYDNTVARDFEVDEKTKGNESLFDLKAKSSKENFQRVKLTFSGDKLKTMEMFDQLGQHTIVRLSNIKVNPGLKTSLFKFKIPKGVDVVKQ